MIAGNWKLHCNLAQASTLLLELRRLLSSMRHCEFLVCPPYTALSLAAQKLEDSRIALGAQDIYYEDQGAFTGTVSGPLLKDVGCTYVLVGHSERRQFFGETLDSSLLRVKAALRAGLKPLLCIGETLEERESNRTAEVVLAQLDAVIEQCTLAELEDLVVAYEPVWAIGTGKVASPQQAQEVHQLIRERFHAKDSALAKNIRLLYGGSVKPDNAAELLSQEDIDGALVGGASLKAGDFAAIARACA